MRRRCSLALPLILPLLLNVTPAAGSARWRALENLPGHVPVTVLVDGKSRIYYRISSAENPAPAFELRGPGRLKIVSRAEVTSGKGGAVSYRVFILEDARVVRQHVTESSVTDRATVHGGSLTVCKSRTFTWGIPEGVHRIRFTALGPPSVLVRLLVASPRSKRPMISITPVEAPRSVTVSEGERMIPYYSVLPGRPVRLRVVGPTSLELTARLDFDPTMRGTQLYRLAVVEQGQRVREFQFKTTKATTASYTDLKDRVASKLNRVVVPVGEGTHEFSVELREPRNGSAEIRVRIPGQLPDGRSESDG